MNEIKGNTIQITSRSCMACPTIFELTLPEGTDGYVKFRHGCVSLYKEDENADLSKRPIISEQISDSHDGFLDLDQLIEWLKSKGYNVAVNDFVYDQIAGNIAL